MNTQCLQAFYRNANWLLFIDRTRTENLDFVRLNNKHLLIHVRYCWLRVIPVLCLTVVEYADAYSAELRVHQLAPDVPLVHRILLQILLPAARPNHHLLHIGKHAAVEWWNFPGLCGVTWNVSSFFTVTLFYALVWYIIFFNIYLQRPSCTWSRWSVDLSMFCLLAHKCRGLVRKRGVTHMNCLLLDVSVVLIYKMNVIAKRKWKMV